MALTTAGRNFIAAAIMNSGPPTFFDAADAYIGSGDDATIFSAAQTDLVAASNKLRVGMDATYPSLATNVISFRATFATGQANWHWQEWGIFNAAAAGTMLCRKAEDLGTKTSAQSWQITAAITISIGS